MTRRRLHRHNPVNNEGTRTHWLLRDINGEPVGVGFFTVEIIECHVFSFLGLAAENISQAQFETYIAMGAIDELPEEYVHQEILKTLR